MTKRSKKSFKDGKEEVGTGEKRELWGGIEGMWSEEIENLP